MNKKQKVKNGDQIHFDMVLSIGDLISCGEIDGLNERADEQNPYSDFMLTDIGYCVIGFKKGEEAPSNISGDVMIRVTAVLEEL